MPQVSLASQEIHEVSNHSGNELVQRSANQLREKNIVKEYYKQPCNENEASHIINEIKRLKTLRMNAKKSNKDVAKETSYQNFN